MGLGRFELPTPRLSSVCSNQAELQARLTPRALDHLRAGSFKTRQDDSHARNTGPDVRRYHIGAVPRHSQESDRSEFQGTARAISQQIAKQDTELLESLERR